MTRRPSHCRILVGTSGYSYTEWIEAGFYPAAMPAGRMLSHYAGAFTITELNFTWYQMPKAQSIDRMRQTTPREFLFTAKLTRTLTHEIDPDAWRAQVDGYRNGIAPLVQDGRLAAVLVQLPPSFERVKANRLYLAALLDALAGLPVAVEFRHVSWAHERVFEYLADRHATLVIVDEPDLPGLFPKLCVVTNPDFFYIRFHGKNAAGWRSGNMQKQFDYDYGEAELQEWIDERILPMAGQARTGIIMFNNHVRGQAPRNARTLIRLLGEAGLTVAAPAETT